MVNEHLSLKLYYINLNIKCFGAYDTVVEDELINSSVPIKLPIRFMTLYGTSCDLYHLQVFR
jgi:hypothetical protein